MRVRVGDLRRKLRESLGVDKQRAYEWLLDNGHEFMTSDEEGPYFDEDSALAALLHRFGLENSAENADELFPIVASYAEGYQ